MDVTTHLQRVIDQKEQTTIIYHGGSSPGTARRISPIELKGDSVVARCLETNARKTFKIGKIELATSQPITPYQPPEDRSAWTLQQHLALHLPDITRAGWHVKAEDDSVELSRLFKNGKPRKTPDLALCFSPVVTRRELDWETKTWVEVTVDSSSKPWKLSCQGSETRSFKSLERAFDAFIGDVKRLATTPLDAE